MCCSIIFSDPLKSKAKACQIINWPLDFNDLKCFQIWYSFDEAHLKQEDVFGKGQK